MVNLLLIFSQTMLLVFAAPLLLGCIKKCKCFLQNRRAPSIWQPYLEIRKLLSKETCVAKNASFIFYITPYIVFAVAVLLCSLVPVFISHPITPTLADIIVILGLFALSRFFLTLAGLDIGTAFGGMGSSREMLIAVLIEPSLMIAMFTLAIIASSTNLFVITNYLVAHNLWLHPSLLLTAVGFGFILLAETGRIPIDNPTTHLELTMLHEAMILEYSGKHLALLEWANQIKLLCYFILLANIFLPSISFVSITSLSIFSEIGLLIGKLCFLIIGLALVETALAKLRLFRAPIFLNIALMLCLLGLINHIILEVI